MVEHFLRLGYYDSAECLATRAGIKDITNLDIFQTAREVELDLAKRGTQKLYAWCMDNRTKLRKINSNIEFLMRVQVDLVIGLVIRVSFYRCFSNFRNLLN